MTLWRAIQTHLLLYHYYTHSFSHTVEILRPDDQWNKIQANILAKLNKLTKLGLHYILRFRFYRATLCYRGICCHRVCPSVRPSVRHKPVLYRNDWTNPDGICHGGFLSPILNCVIRKFGYLQKLGYIPLEICPKLRT